jgi:hypothetical protein
MHARQTVQTKRSIYGFSGFRVMAGVLMLELGQSAPQPRLGFLFAEPSAARILLGPGHPYVLNRPVASVRLPADRASVHESSPDPQAVRDNAADDVLDVTPLDRDGVAQAESVCREMLGNPLVRLMRERVEEIDGSAAGNLEVDLSHDGLPVSAREAAHAVEEG